MLIHLVPSILGDHTHTHTHTQTWTDNQKWERKWTIRMGATPVCSTVPSRLGGDGQV